MEKEKLKQSHPDQQRLTALKHSLEIVRAFATPSLAPDWFDWFEKIEKELIERYSS